MTDRTFQLTGINQAIACALLDEHDAFFLGVQSDWPAGQDVSSSVQVRDWSIAIHDAGCAIEMRCEGHVFDYVFDDEFSNEQLVEERDRLATLIAKLIAEQEADQLILFEA